jgi:hypothetical protein
MKAEEAEVCAEIIREYGFQVIVGG